LLETALAWEKLAIAEFLKTGETPQRTGASGPVISPNGAYTTSDGDLMVAIGTDVMFATFSRLVGAPQWAEEPRYSTNHQRAIHADQLAQDINDKLLVKTRAQWAEIFEQYSIPNASIQDTVSLMHQFRIFRKFMIIRSSRHWACCNSILMEAFLC